MIVGHTVVNDWIKIVLFWLSSKLKDFSKSIGFRVVSVQYSVLLKSRIASVVLVSI